MRFGLMHLFSDYGKTSQEQAFADFMAEVEFAEQLGYDAIWLAEHHFSIYGMLGDTLTLAAAVAQRTRKIQIGTSVVLLPLQHPVRVAEQAALVDVLSNGRLLLGLGRGYQPLEFGGFGVNPGETRDRFNEALMMLVKVFTEEHFSHQGRFWSCEDVTLYPKPVQRPHPPLYMAAVTPPSFKIAADYGLPILRAPRFTRMDLVEEQWLIYRRIMEEAGHHPLQMDQPMLLQTYVAKEPGRAVKEAEEHAMWYHKLFQDVLPGAPNRKITPGYELYEKVYQAHGRVTYDDISNWGSAFGTPEQVAEKIVTYARHSGVTHWMAEMKFGGFTHRQAMDSMELFATEVMPLVRRELAEQAA